MWKLVFFLPLFILTGYIIYKDIQDGKAEESEDEFKSYCVSLAEKLLQKEDEQVVEQYLRTIQRSGEEIFIEICLPEPDLPGYPHTDYHPIDFPAIL